MSFPCELQHSLTTISHIRPPATGAPQCTWFPRRGLGTGDLAETTGRSTTSQPLTISHALPAGLHSWSPRCYNLFAYQPAFHQIRIEPSNIPKTAITIPFGLYEFIRMPFGPHIVAQTFLRFMDEGLDFCFDYIVDLLVASSSQELSPPVGAGTSRHTLPPYQNLQELLQSRRTRLPGIPEV